MLASAGAARWNVARDQVKPGKRFDIGPAGQKASFGELAAAAAAMLVPEKPPLKDPKDFRVVGKRTQRLDTPVDRDGCIGPETHSGIESAYTAPLRFEVVRGAGHFPR